MDGVNASADLTRSSTRPDDEIDQTAAAREASVNSATQDSKRQSGDYLEAPGDYMSAGGSPSLSGMDTPSTPGLSRTASNSDFNGTDAFGNEAFPPVDRLTFFDIIENLALPQRLEKMQTALQMQSGKLREQRQKLASRAKSGRSNLVGEWKKRVPLSPDEQLEKYRRRMRESVDRLGKRWEDAKSVSLNEKISFVTAVLNIFISGYLIGAFPEYFHIWYTVQLAYFMPVRWYKYHKIGFHYFLADLCYFVNLLMVLSIWFFPQSKRLFIATYCLAMGNNAVAIAMWRNSLVFHSLDKVTSLFIHIMPCATLHVLVHLIPPSLQALRFPSIWHIKYSDPNSPEHYGIVAMIVWMALPYAVWQLSYHFLITVRKRSKIEAGRPTSFTWLKKSYKDNPLGKFVLSCPEWAQEPVFMVIQYSYALLTMLPCPLWFWYRWCSAGYLMVVFAWASWNGATFYIDAYGRRMEKELESLRKEVARLSKTPEMGAQEDGASNVGSPRGPEGNDEKGESSALDLGPSATGSDGPGAQKRSNSTATAGHGGGGNNEQE
ncbi:hypothetical protein MBLNU230_g2483t1 [Neophaeotheca triangularis]